MGPRKRKGRYHLSTSTENIYRKQRESKRSCLWMRPGPLLSLFTLWLENEGKSSGCCHSHEEEEEIYTMKVFGPTFLGPPHLALTHTENLLSYPLLLEAIGSFFFLT
ncbi:hypothetical protein ACOSP7_005644 [Xanthoceras sorbifolium]